ncbi:helix-turn-helix domain-containing protein [Streptomyces fractus]|uniref:helix-turn-helix domain-containing protein n=1 Tax=Streptomyces fractus TaxID=641806 RepID=UPI003CF84AB4
MSAPTPMATRERVPQHRAVPALYSTKEAAAYLGVAVATMRTWRHRRRGPKSFRMEGRIVYRRVALDEFIDACESADSRSNPALNPLNREVERSLGRSVAQPVGGGVR